MHISSEELNQVLNNIDKYYYSFSKIKLDKNNKPKIKNGIVQKRHYKPSKELLRHIQNKIKDNILADIQLPGFIMGGIKGKSNIANAFRHKGKKNHFETDITKFFPSINSEMVYRMFRHHGFSKSVSKILTKLTVIDNQLPQGAPTSTSIANLVFLKVDYQIIKLIEPYKVTYTRWVDDLTFSSQQDFTEVQPQILSIIGNNGFKPSRGKTRGGTGRRDITGVNIGNNTGRVTSSFRAKGKATLNERQIRGREQYEAQVKAANKKKAKYSK